MRTTIAKTWRFDAAHRLANHDGKCARPHGHTYAVTVAVEGEPAPVNGAPDEGMVIDFGFLEEVWRGLEPLLDHQDLNKTLGEDIPVTTCELIAEWVWERFDDYLANDQDVHLAYVRAAETPTTYAEVRG